MKASADQLLNQLLSLANQRRDVVLKVAETEAWLSEKQTSTKLLSSFASLTHFDASQRCKELAMLLEDVKSMPKVV